LARIAEPRRKRRRREGFKKKKKKKRKGKHEMRAACGQEADVSECLLCPKEVGLWTHFTDRLGEVKRLGRPVFK
jgi:hypothetical protein